jgi:hypothetical protein
MSADITVTLSEMARERAQAWAARAGRSLSDFLADAIESSLLPLGDFPPAVETWSDADVLSAVVASMSPEEDRRLSELLARQRETQINEQEQVELARLMQLYQQGLVRKAAAMEEAVRRGLRARLGSE